MPHLHPDKLVSVERVLARKRARQGVSKTKKDPKPSRGLVAEIARRYMLGDRGQ